MPIRASPDFTLEKLAPGVHAAIARIDGHALSNAAIVDLGNTTVVFDAMMTPRAGAALGRVARKLTGRVPDFVVDSHYHHDHVWGAGAVAPVRVVSTRRTRELLARGGRKEFLSMRRVLPRELRAIDAPGSTLSDHDRRFLRGWFRGVLAMPASFSVRLPDLTLDSELVLHGSRRTIRLITRGGGHSPSDLFAYLEDERIAFLGDLVVKGMHPSVGDGFPREWIRILDVVRRLRPDRVVPGHGPIGTARDVPVIQQYLRDLMRVAARAGTVSSASVPIPDRYRRWAAAPFFESNLDRARTLLRSERRRAPSR